MTVTATCQGCGTEIPTRATYCGSACRQRAYRARQARARTMTTTTEHPTTSVEYLAMLTRRRVEREALAGR